jgi:hypothetical protein
MICRPPPVADGQTVPALGAVPGILVGNPAVRVADCGAWGSPGCRYYVIRGHNPSRIV